ncbi:MAG TPA: alpha/beta fold hydrolase [Flavobacteriales bacterium]|nr:alpha/beta fold hydrolase [Flavobacteriales bacterium]HIN39052.1 alpha/beta fold hydrolase [Flavobacteriales bacterium]
MRLNFKKLGQGPPLLILHGLFGSGNNWKTIAKSFIDHFEVYLIDLRNHGKSPHSDAFNYDLMAEDIDELLRDNGLKRVNILGHSMGGKVAINFSLRNPDKVLKLIVIDIGIKEYPVKDIEMLEALMKMDFNKILTRQDADKCLAKAVSEFNVRQFLLQNLYWTKDRKLAWKMNLKALVKRIDEIGKPQFSDKPFINPCLFVKGSDSDYVLDEDREEIDRVFTNCEIRSISGANHWVHIDKPREFLAIISDFLN